jgi:membrane associated rhomboid family serine protease
MIPLRSSERVYTPPTVTLILILINVLVFVYELTLSRYGLNRFIATYGIVPDRFHWSQLLTSMFIHGGFMHILGNMWFLWVFGRGIEDLIGHGRFLVFYLACGVAAGLIQMMVNYSSPIPTVGASGAIAGVMGGYLVKFPRARVVTLIFIFIFITTVDLPAFVLLLYWFAIQFFSGFGSIADSQSWQGGDVAYFAHIGGFLAGMGLIFLLPTKQRYRSWS